MDSQKDPTIASFDFGAYGKIELTKTKLIGSVISARMPGQTSGRQASMKGERSEFRAKLDQVQNFEVQPPKSLAKKIFWLLWVALPLAFPLRPAAQEPPESRPRPEFPVAPITLADSGAI